MMSQISIGSSWFSWPQILLHIAAHSFMYLDITASMTHLNGLEYVLI